MNTVTTKPVGTIRIKEVKSLRARAERAEADRDELANALRIVINGKTTGIPTLDAAFSRARGGA